MKKFRSENKRTSWHRNAVCAAAFFWGILLGAPLVVFSPSSAATLPTLYSVAGSFKCSPTGDQLCRLLREVNPWTGATISSVEITLTGKTIVGATGLAADPTTQTLYALLRIGEAENDPKARILVTIDPATGVATSIGTTDKKGFADLAFDPVGTLYGVTGNGAGPDDRQTLFVLDKTDAHSHHFLTLGNGNGGEAIAFNPDDGLMYHASGFCRTPCVSEQIFESIDLTTKVITDIPLSGTGTVYEEATGMTYGGEGVFLVGSFGLFPLYEDPSLFTVTSSGVVSIIGLTEDLSGEVYTATGLAFVRFSVGGSISGISTDVTVKCKNETTGQIVAFELLPDVTAWDCEAEGLDVMPGDEIEMEMEAAGTAN